MSNTCQNIRHSMSGYCKYTGQRQRIDVAAGRPAPGAEAKNGAP